MQDASTSSGWGPDPGELYELAIANERALDIIHIGFYHATACLLPEVQQWVDDNLQGGVSVELRWDDTTMAHDQNPLGLHFVAVLNGVEDAALFRLFWL